MDWGALMEMASRWGLGIVLSIALLFMFNKFMTKAMSSLNEERVIYKSLIEKQGSTIDNHISHLTDSISASSQKIAELNTGLATQKESLEHGFNRVVDAIRGQTDTLSMKIDGQKK